MVRAIPKPIRTAHRWLIRLIGIAAFILVVGYVALRIAVRAVLASLLSGNNLPPVTYDLHRVSPWHFVVGDIRFGHDGPRIGLLSADYSPMGLIHRHLRSLTIAGAEATADLSNNSLQIKGLPFGATTQPAGAVPTTPATAASTGFDSSILPDDVELQAAVIQVNYGAHTLTIPVSAHLSSLPDGSRHLNGSLELGPDKLTLSGSGNSPSDLTADLKGTLSAATLLPLLPPNTLPTGATTDAVATVTASADLPAQTYRATAVIDNASARIAGAELSGLSLELSGTKAPLSPFTATAKLLTHLTYAPWLTDGLTVAANTTWDGAVLKGSASASNQLGSDEAPGATTGATAGVTARATVGATTRGMSAVPTTSPAGDVSPLAVTVPDFIYTPATKSASATLEALVTPTPELTRRLQLAGITLTDIRPLVLKAAAQLTDATVTARITDLAGGAGNVTAISGPTVVRLDSPSMSIPIVDAVYADDRLTLTATNPTVRLANLHAPGAPEITRTEGLTLTGSSLTLTRDADGRLTAATPRLNVTLASSDLSTPAATLKNLSARLGLSGHYSPDETLVTLSDDSTVAWSAVTGENSSWSVSPGTANLLPRRVAATQAVVVEQGGKNSTTQVARVTTAPSTGPAALIPFLTLKSGQDPAVSLRAEINQKVTATSAGNTLSLASARLSATLGLGSTLSLSGYAALNDADVDSTPFGVSLKGLSVSWPISLDATIPLEGTFKVGSVLARGQSLPGLTGTMWITRREAEGGFEWPLVPNGVVKASGKVFFLPNRTIASARAWIPEFEFTDAPNLRQLLPQGLSDAAITGKFSAKVQYSIDGSEITRWGEVEVKDASIKSTLADAEASGISGHVWTREFSPLETPPNQTLSVKAARQGKLNVTDGSVNFRVDPGNIIFAESASFGFAGGTLSARGFRVDPANAAAELYIYGDHLDLNEIAQLASDGKVSGTGKLYARLPVSVRYKDNYISLGDGYLYVQPPRNTTGALGTLGSLQLGPYANQVTDLAVKQLPPGQLSDQLKARLYATLANFNYSALSFEFTRPDDKLKVAVHTEGKGPPDAGSQPLDLTLNLTGLEDALTLWLGIRGKLSQ